MHTFKWLPMTVLLATCLALISCRDQQINDFQERTENDMIINLPGVNQVSIRGEKRDIISVAELLRLRIQQTGLQDQLHSVQLTPRDSIILFQDVIIENESAVISAEILSNNSTQIYFGNDNLTVSDDKFVMEIVLDPVTGILAAGPDSMAINPTDTMWVFNKGVETLLWEITAVTSDPEDFTLEFGLSRGELLPNSSVPVTIYSQSRDLNVDYTVRLESQVGHVDLNLRTEME